MYNFIFVTEDKLGTYMYIIYVPSIYIVRSVLNYRQWLCGGGRGAFFRISGIFQSKNAQFVYYSSLSFSRREENIFGVFFASRSPGAAKSCRRRQKRGLPFFFLCNQQKQLRAAHMRYVLSLPPVVSHTHVTLSLQTILCLCSFTNKKTQV